MADIADLERRVIALEAANNENTRTLNWVVGTLGRVAADVAAVKDDVRVVKDDVAALRKEFRGHQERLPSMIAETMREVLREQKP
jgi:hypothetical protein